MDSDPTVPSPVKKDPAAAPPAVEPPAPSRRFGCLPVLLGLVLLGAAVFAGAWFSQQILGSVGVAPPANAPTAEAPQEKQLWTCSMHPQVIQDHPGMCPICHMALEPMKSPTAGGGSAMAAAPSERKIRYYWDPMMDPPYISDKPGKSPMGMDLVPVYEDEVSAGPAVTIDPTVIQNIGVRTASVSIEPLVHTVRAVGYLKEAEPNIYDYNVRVQGWIEKLHADTEGMHVEQGAPLFELYSPEMRQAIQELIVTRRATALTNKEQLLEAIRGRLSLWGLPRAQISRLEALNAAPRTITFTSPITGNVLEKSVVEGSAVEAGDRIFRLVDHSTLWLDAQVYERDLPFIELGQKVSATVTSKPGEVYEGTVTFLHPHVDPATRTASVRIEVPNPSLTLRPGMYASVALESQIAERALMVPREAVIDTGTRKVAFVMTDQNRFEPRSLELGLSSDEGRVQVLEGLAPEEQVVTSAQFLLDAESRLQEGIQKYLAGALGETPAVPELPASGPANDQPIQLVQGPQVPELDAFFTRYFDVTAALGEPQTSDTPLNPEELLHAAHALQSKLNSPELKAITGEIVTAVEQLHGKTLDEQREQYKKVSDAVLKLAELAPPSPAVSDHLYVMYCSMAPGQWLQKTDEIANPYYATAMKQCGELVKTIRPVEDGQS